MPLATGVLTQPFTGSHVSVVQTLLSLQLSGVPAMHVPLRQLSAPLQTVPSRHAVPFSTGEVVQPDEGLQPSVVQGLLSLQTSGVPVRQVPPRHVSGPLQTLPSLHEEP